jgi:hypothetical protein
MSELPAKHRRSPLWWRFARLLSSPHAARNLAYLSLDGYLATTGWLRSLQEGRPVGAEGEPMPWTTLPFNAFFIPRLQKTWTVFEYGCGASTIFYAGRVGAITAVEHDAAFADEVKKKLPANGTLLVRQMGTPEYIESIRTLQVPPQVAIVDGRDRVKCVDAARGWLASDGVLVLDDSERADYAPAVAGLRRDGFKQLDFWGISAGSGFNRSTSVFYRADNVLGL